MKYNIVQWFKIIEWYFLFRSPRQTLSSARLPAFLLSQPGWVAILHDALAVGGDGVDGDGGDGGDGDDVEGDDDGDISDADRGGGPQLVERLPSEQPDCSGGEI